MTPVATAPISNIVLVSPGGITGGGGVGSVSREIHDWLATNRPDIDVSVVDTWGDGTRLVWPLMVLRSLGALVVLRLRGRTLLHIQVTEGGSLFRKGLVQGLGRALGMRTVLHHHGAKLEDDFAGYSAGMRKWLTDLVTAADINVTLGQRGRQFLVEKLGVDAGKIVVLPNAINDLKGLRTGLRKPGAPMHYLLMANLSPRKGVSEFLQALRQLKSSGQAVRATLAGGGEIDRYRGEAEELGLAGDCTFTGWIKRDRVANLLSEADALVLPSHQEVLPMAILEALSAGLPVIATPVGSIPEVLRDGLTGLLVEPGDVVGLTSAMRRLAEDAALGHLLVANARALYEDQFEMGRYMKGLMGVWARAISG